MNSVATCDSGVIPISNVTAEPVSLLQSVFWFVSWMFFKVANWLVLHLPQVILNVLSAHLEISLSLSSVLVIFGTMVTMCYLVVRYIFLTRYSKKTAAKNDKVVSNLLRQLSSKNMRKKKGINYLDEFLSAIKIFGYLERPVFNELTKSMTTQKLEPDEILYLDESLGFSIVVEGVMQVYTRLAAHDAGHKLSFDDGDKDVLMLGKQRYQLLNEVKSGAPLSSLISTLELFEEKKRPPFGDLLAANKSKDSSCLSFADSQSESEYTPSIVARARPGEGGATIAIIPRLAFQRVHRKHPKATSHIVTMVLTRLYKVTMKTMHDYLGLTKEIVATEMRLNEGCEKNVLPAYLFESIKSVGSVRRDKYERANMVSRNSSRYVLLDSRTKSSHPGDLLSSVPISRRKDVDDRHAEFSSQFEETEESSLRTAIVENVFKMIGIEDGEVPSVSSSSSSQVFSTDEGNKFFHTVRMDGENEHDYFRRGHGDGHDDLKKGLEDHDYFKKDDRKNGYRARRGSVDYSFSTIKRDFSKTLTIKYVPAGTVLAEEASLSTGLYYVLDGSVDVCECKKKLYSVPAGGVAGYLTSVLGFRSLTSITVGSSGAVVAHFGKEAIQSCMDRYYFLLLPVATKLKSLLSPQLLTIDFALEWCHIPAGGVLCAQGDWANGFHIVLSGRFRVVRREGRRSEKDPKNANELDKSSNEKDLRNINELDDMDDLEILGEYGHGESIGEVEVLTASRRTSSLIAVRDSETARIPRSLFEMLSMQNPSLMVKVSRIVAHKVVAAESESQPGGVISTSTTPYVSTDYKTIAIVPCQSGLGVVRDFAERLESALRQIGRSVMSLDRASTLSLLGRNAFDERLAHLKLAGYYAYLEEEYETVLYVCDAPLRSNWTSTCIAQADCILFLADAADEAVASNIGDYERLLPKVRTTARTDLCLLHRERIVEPGSTSKWLKARDWVQGHHHIQMEVSKPQEVQQKNIIQDIAARIRSRHSFLRKKHETHDDDEDFKDLGLQPHKNDFLRLARLLSNEAVGLVLGGGGSRGVAHVGVVTALEKHGIPVDLIGGTSIGSFVGGLYAKEYNIVSIYGRAKRFARRVASMWRSVLDLTYPVTSYITGYEFNRGIWKVFGSYEIEDFWIRYFCNSTNITNSTMDIHESGYSWRFIRASMSLAGLLPPIAYKGCMLLDGGYLDNLPVAEMKKKGAKYIIAVDVGSADDRTPMDYGDTLSGFWVLFNRWNPFSRHPNPPNMMDIQMRLAYVASVNALNQAKNTPGVIYMRPPIDNYATLDFGKFDEIYHVGLAYADALFEGWEREGKVPQIAGMVDKRRGREVKIYRRNSI